MADSHRISPSLLLACCLALAAAPAANGQEQPSPSSSTSSQTVTVPPPPAAPPPLSSETPPAAPAMAGPGVTNNPQPPAPPPVAPAAPKPPPPAPVPPDQLQFQLKFPPQKGKKEGGAAVGSAGTLEYKREDYAVLAGNVHIHYQDIDLQADQAEIDLSTRDVIALGNVVIDQGPRRMTGLSSTFNLDSKTGTLKQATARVSADYYFSGSEIVKTGDHTYEVTNGIFTSCDQPVPDWSFRLGRARIEVQGYAHMSNVSMRVKKVPVLYLPYVLWPAKSERSSGFLVPTIGYSERRGAQLGLAYFQTLGRSYDTTIHTDLFTKNFLGIGNEFKYRPTAGTTGDLIGYMVHDGEKIPGEPTHDQWRWKVEWDHVTNDLPYGMRGLVHYLNYSDFNFFRDFERDFDRNTVRFLDSRASATGNWGANLLNILVDNRETFTGATTDTVIQRKLPDVDYHLRSTRVGTSPFYLQFDGSAAYLDVTQPGNYSGKYGRFDLFPQVTLPIRSFPWLSLSVTGGERFTWYGDSLRTTPTDGGGTVTDFRGQAVTRALPYGTVEIVGPSISRIFDLNLGPFGKFKNVIEPRFKYTYEGTFDDQQSIPQFDEVDTQFASNIGTVFLDSRFLGKPKDEKQSARQVLLLELSRSYSFDKNEPLLGVASVIDPNSTGGILTPGITTGTLSSQAGPVQGLVDFAPSERTSLKLNATYDTLYKHLSSTGLSGNYGVPSSNFVGVTWFTNYETDNGETLGNQIRLNGGIALIPRKLRLEGQVNYDIQNKLVQQQRYLLTWTSQCYGVTVELRDFRTLTGVAGETESDKEIRFSLSLKNVGTFLDLTSRSSSIVQ